MQTRVDDFWRIPLRQTYIWVQMSKHRIAIPHSKSTQYTLSISCLYHLARSGCSVSDCFAAQIFFYLPFISPFEPGKEFLIEFAHGRSRLAANQAAINMGRDINILPIFSALWPHPHRLFKTHMLKAFPSLIK